MPWNGFLDGSASDRERDRVFSDWLQDPRLGSFTETSGSSEGWNFAKVSWQMRRHSKEKKQKNVNLF